MELSCISLPFFVMIPRTLRAANCGLYIGCIALIIFAVVYVALTKELEPWALYSMIAAGVVGSMWGASYIFFAYRVDAEGITRKSMLSSRRILWVDVTDVQFTETDCNGIASCVLELVTPSCHFTLSSEVLVLDDIKDLMTELKDFGVMKNADDASK